MNSIYFAKNALLIRRSLVRAQVEEPNLKPRHRKMTGLFCFFKIAVWLLIQRLPAYIPNSIRLIL